MEPQPAHRVKLYITVGCYSMEPPPSHLVNYTYYNVGCLLYGAPTFTSG